MTYFVHHQDFTKNFDSCEVLLSKTARSLKKIDGFFERERFVATKINQASLNIVRENFQFAIDQLDSIKISHDSYLFNSLKKFLYYKKHLAYRSLGVLDSSLKYHNFYLLEELRAHQTNSQSEIAELETKYQTTKKEKLILEEQQKARTNRNWLIAAGVLLFLGTGIAILLQKNTAKKRLLAEQQQQIEKQKVETLLKEQELVSIDSMIVGQEKRKAASG